MSCLNLRLPPAKKAWKTLASKLLHKLHMSKTIKKPCRHRPNVVSGNNTVNSAKAIMPPVLLEKRYQKRKQLGYSPRSTVPFKPRSSSRFGHFQKRSAPVYIDKLFREPLNETLVSMFPPVGKDMKLVDVHQSAAAAATTVAEGTSMEAEKGSERDCAADDMWESLGFASPQMRGIDERAEQFILTFRADMEVQEMIARGL